MNLVTAGKTLLTAMEAVHTQFQSPAQFHCVRWLADVSALVLLTVFIKLILHAVVVWVHGGLFNIVILIAGTVFSGGSALTGAKNTHWRPVS
jgi:hypothetical protein